MTKEELESNVREIVYMYGCAIDVHRAGCYQGDLEHAIYRVMEEFDNYLSVDNNG